MSARVSGRHAAVALGGQWTKYGVQIVALMLFSRMLNPEEFGFVAMVVAVVGVAHVLGDFGLSLAALSAPDLTARQRSNLFWISTGIGAVLAAAVCASAPLLVAVYDEPAVGPVAYGLSVVFLLNGLAGQFRTELNRASRFGVLAGADVVGQVVGLAGGLVTILAGGGHWGLVVQQVAAAAVTLVVLAGRAGWWPGLPGRGAGMGGLLRFGGLTFAAQVANYVSSNVDSVLVGRVWGPTVLGAYNRAFQVARLPVQQVAAPLTRVVLPQLTARRADPVAFAGAVRTAQLLLCTLLLGVLSLIAGAARPLVEVVLGDGWDQAVPYVRALCLGGAFQAAGYVCYWVLLAQDRAGVLLASELGARTVMVAMMVVAAPWGPTWVALAAAAGQLLLLLAAAVVALPRVGIPSGLLLAVPLRPAAVFAVACGVTAWADARWGGQLGAVPALLVAAVVWVLACTPALLSRGCRADLGVLVATGRSVLGRSPA
ncbi:oligosaccharide flippase family protein [Nocardioides sp. SOB77]|uniref:Oligosaccharide flippase family protein n=1 Tax=Nocardioides oceani TaxID=3058369 RepID=A0ABT8FJE3_9ACTN|nr:oligosaccharide flippase family protein [Nocardioides oceani]MDN4174570.1 oligosaccharide flippase family protein [Nocardioides oceani]